ncbi:ATP-grasp domain-containing protein [Flavobacterium oreochromis]|uniref:ATP-grasp domain-containing protein n=1 Tax=Flavobacterium oreochromis TaxID=2906078 RepID=A0ABW8P7T5_9FLAO|nr:ATP-grasp domain-containing protein [Flavobacterium oreochromis]OWP77585.1 carbamoyl phosphate synthase [Flavobacterium oreochromis]
MKNILVTGAGSLLGQGLLRLLKISDFEKKIYTADPMSLSSGHWLGDEALLIPKVTEENYLDEIKKIVFEKKIDAILVGTDVELPILARNKSEFLNLYNCKIIVSDIDVINISNDKYLTAEFLKENNFPYPFSVMANDLDGMQEIKKIFGFPLFAKPIDGARSLGIKIINNDQELDEIYDENSNLTIQQYLDEDDGEYTSGCLVVEGKCKAIVTLRRDLRDGNTYRAYRDEFTSKYDEVIIKIAECLNPDGPVNFQFRIFNSQPVIFEINGRFSGTTPLRYFFGFNEVQVLLNYYLFGKQIVKPTLKMGTVLRVWSDLFVENKQINDLNTENSLVNPSAIFYNFNLLNE